MFAQRGGFKLSRRLLRRVSIFGISGMLLRGVTHGMDICMDISMNTSGCLLRGMDLWTKSGCLLRGVALDFPVGVNRGGYYYDVTISRLKPMRS